MDFQLHGRSQGVLLLHPVLPLLVLADGGPDLEPRRPRPPPQRAVDRQDDRAGGRHRRRVRRPHIASGRSAHGLGVLQSGRKLGVYDGAVK